MDFALLFFLVFLPCANHLQIQDSNRAQENLAKQYHYDHFYLAHKHAFSKLDKLLLQMGRIGEELDLDFVVSTGDNFYDNGLKAVNDPAFRESFSEIYSYKSLRKPWYSGEFKFGMVNSRFPVHPLIWFSLLQFWGIMTTEEM